MYEKFTYLQCDSLDSSQKSILHVLQMLSGMKTIAMEYEPFSSQDIEEGQVQFYQFMEQLYLHMFDHPEYYCIPVKEYDAYMETETARAKKLKLHQTDTKECNLRNTFQQSIQFYANYLYRLGQAATTIDEHKYSMLIPKETYFEIKEQMKWTHIYKENEHRYEKLYELGMTEQEHDTYYEILCHTYPKMFLGLWLLCQVKNSPYHYMNYLRLDYAGTQKQSPDFADIKETLNDESCHIIGELQNLLVDLKIRVKVKPLRNLTSGCKWKVEFQSQVKSVLGFYASPDFFMICIYFNKASNITEFAKRLETQQPDLFEWYRTKFPERLCTCPYNRRVLFGQEYQRICGFSNRAEIISPTEKDLEHTIQITRLFRNI